MKRVLRGTALVLGIVLALSLSSCDWFLELMAAPQGYVYDIDDGSPISSATVRITYKDGTTKTTSTNSNGYYTFSDVEYGEVELTATKTGYVFTKQRTAVSGVAQYLPNVGGYVPGNEAFRIVVLWNRDFADVDSYLTMTKALGYTNGQVSQDPVDFYTTTASVDLGFFTDPDDFGAPAIGTDRSIVDLNFPILYDGAFKVAEFVTDNSGASDEPLGGPETITVDYFPFDASVASGATYEPVASDNSGLDINLTYDWVGTMDYWLHAYASVYNTPTAGSLLSSSDFLATAADPVVYIFDAAGVQHAAFTLPPQNIKTASIVRINMMYGSDGGEYYQFLPNVRAYSDYTDVRSLDSGDLAPFVIKGKTRK